MYNFDHRFFDGTVAYNLPVIPWPVACYITEALRRNPTIHYLVLPGIVRGKSSSKNNRVSTGEYLLRTSVSPFIFRSTVASIGVQYRQQLISTLARFLSVMGDVQTPRQSRNSNSNVKGSSTTELPGLMDHLSLVPKVSFVRSSCSALSNIAKLDESASLVLFTPVIPSPTSVGQSRSSGTVSRQVPVDPFEVFGRDLAKHHERIQHVPYHPSVGMTGTHEQFARRAGAIIIVIWGPTTAKSDNPSSSPFVAATAEQRAFADAVREKASSASKSASTTPLLLFITGTSKTAFTEKDLGDKFRNYENILHSREYNQTTSRQVVDILFPRY